MKEINTHEISQCYVHTQNGRQIHWLVALNRKRQRTLHCKFYEVMHGKKQIQLTDSGKL